MNISVETQKRIYISKTSVEKRVKPFKTPPKRISKSDCHTIDTNSYNKVFLFCQEKNDTDLYKFFP